MKVTKNKTLIIVFIAVYYLFTLLRPLTNPIFGEIFSRRLVR